MTNSVIAPVVIPATPLRSDGHTDGSVGTSGARRTLPLPTVPTPRTSSIVYGLAAVDCRGRPADHTVVTALGWVPGTRLDIRESGGLLLIRSDVHGVFSVTKQGHLRLPAPVRHCCGLIPGDRVLLAADPQRDLLIVHPPAVLDDLLAQCHAQLLDGDLT
ncbi:MAG TPA: AbrB/MazE/SpoVT family DNA-binding domain-containing protein [Amycolatopsis sp.]|uniref:AbrB/MazE/SpoVT family DNA-binding domain-containing protein n=1 Tax=Amycolatopsis sp. TaxID=37632 RepID=UPI002B490FE8|nr:AbrB/MazE/SpoVT family DNA-binding domain-containing protein [Amycolatopsis sp.]HKS46095.1 AbrB/MazE/SpoVT family DNA-binding domain-containing protein [Amycolatopsis sp.]